jgi:hypothetical protein
MSDSRDLLINFYELKKVKKYCKDLPDTQHEKTSMKLNKPHILCCGSTGSGKSCGFLMNYIFRTNDTFAKIIFICEKDEPLIQYLKEKMPENLDVHLGIDNLPDISTFPDSCKLKEPKRYLLIFDDQIVALMKSKTNQVKVNNYFMYGRNKGIQCVFLTQSYYATPKFIRLNVSYTILCSIRSKNDLRMILNEYNVSDVSQDDMYEIWKYCSTLQDGESFSFMKIATFHTALNKKISRNFLEYIKLEDFKDEEDSD